eukprot:892634_1
MEFQEVPERKLEDVDFTDGYVPVTMKNTGVVGSYGGGNAFVTPSPLIYSRPLSKVPKSLMNSIDSHIKSVLEENDRIPKDKQFANLPKAGSLPPINSDSWHIEAFLQVAPHPFIDPDESEQIRRKRNMMYHGWLFQDLVKTDSINEMKFPLVGMVDPIIGIDFDAYEGESDVAIIGHNRLKWADQHIHKLSADSDWLLGSDMARFYVNSGDAIAGGWVVAVDASGARPKINLTFLCIVRPDLEDGITRILRSAEKDCRIRNDEILKFVTQHCSDVEYKRILNELILNA